LWIKTNDNEIVESLKSSAPATVATDVPGISDLPPTPNRKHQMMPENQFQGG